MRIVSRLVVVAILLFPLSSYAAQWTAAGVTGSISPSSPNAAPAWNGPGITYSSGYSGTSSITITYNVTSDTAQPGWTDLTMGYSNAFSAGAVVVTLYRVSLTTGNRASICSTGNSLIDNIEGCSFAATAVNFDTFAYYVQVVLSRTSTSEFPQINFLKINS